MSFQPGDVFASYRIVEKLGEGGMGEVYRAHQVKLNRPVALKVLKGDGEHEELTRRFVRETNVHMRLSHPHLVRVYDGGQEAGVRYLVLELVEGQTLRQVIHRGPQSWELAAGGLAQILDALAYLESSRIVHRDLKPENILVDRLGSFKVVDFGLVKQEAATVLTRADQVVGTVKYLAPELLDGEAPGPKVDVYAAGLIFFEMLTGQLPYKGKDTPDWLRLIADVPIPSLRDFRQVVSEAQVDFVALLLARDPKARPSASEALILLRDLEIGGARRRTASDRRPAISSIGPGPARSTQVRQRRPIGYGLPALAVVGLAAFGMVVTRDRIASTSPPVAPSPSSAASRESPAPRRPEVGWVLEIPKELPAGVPVVPSWRDILTRDGKPLTTEEWKVVLGHNERLDDGESSDVWLALAVHHGRALGTKRDLQKARHFLKKAVRAGNGFAMAAHGWDPKFSRGPDGALLDHEAHDAIIQKWLEARAREGDASALCELGYFTRNRDRYAESIRWFEKAADRGLGIACYELGKLHEDEHYTKAPDYATAQKWYQRGAKLSNPESIRSMGRKAHFTFKAGNPEGRKQAFKLFREAAAMGDPWSCLHVGEYHEEGALGPRDSQEAAEWFRRSLAFCVPEAFDDVAYYKLVDHELSKRGYKPLRASDDRRIFEASIDF